MTDRAPNVPSAWRLPLLALSACLAWIVAWHFDTAAAMVTIWERSGTFTHCFFILPISLWLIWRQRHVLAGLAPRPSPLWLALFGLVAFGWLLGELVAVNSVTQFALVALLVLAVPIVLGPEVARAILFPLAFLFFAVPFGEFAMPQFMDWTAHFTVLALRLTGIPVYQEGLQFVIPSGRWSVVEACSGIRYLIASVVVGTLFAYLNYVSLKRRLVFVLVSILVPIVANWLRAYIIVMLGHLSGNKLAVGVDHLIYGWVFFGVVIMVMFLIGARWAEHVPAVPAAVAPRTLPVATGRLAWATVALCLLAVLPHLWLAAVTGIGAAPALAAPAPAGWRAEESGPRLWRPAFANPSAEFQAEYRQGERQVGVFIGYYRDQDYERKLVSSSNVLVKSQDPDWILVGRGGRTVGLDGRPVSIRTAELSGGSGIRLMVWQWYWIDGRWTASDHLAKVYTALSRLMARGDDSAVVILYADQSQPGGAEAALEAFVGEAGPALAATLRATRGRR